MQKHVEFHLILNKALQNVYETNHNMGKSSLELLLWISKNKVGFFSKIYYAIPNQAGIKEGYLLCTNSFFHLNSESSLIRHVLHVQLLYSFSLAAFLERL